MWFPENDLKYICAQSEKRKTNAELWTSRFYDSSNQNQFLIIFVLSHSGELNEKYKISHYNARPKIIRIYRHVKYGFAFSQCNYTMDARKKPPKIYRSSERNYLFTTLLKINYKNIIQSEMSLTRAFAIAVSVWN